MFFNAGDNIILGHAADDLVYDLSALEEQEIRDTHNVITSGYLLVLVYVELADLERAVGRDFRFSEIARFSFVNLYSTVPAPFSLYITANPNYTQIAGKIKRI